MSRDDIASRAHDVPIQISWETPRQKLLRFARLLMDFSAFSLLAPLLSVTVLFLAGLGVAATVAIVSLFGSAVGLHWFDGVARAVIEGLAENWTLVAWAISLPLAVGVVAILFAVARSGRSWAAFLVLALSPLLYLAVARFIAEVSPYGDAGSPQMAIGLLLVLGGLLQAAPIFAALAALLVIVSDFLDMDSLGSKRRRWPVFSMPLLVTRYAVTGGRLWIAILQSVAALLGASVLTAVGFLVIAGAGIAGGGFLARQIMPSADEGHLSIFAELIWAIIVFSLLVLQSVRALIKQQGISIIHWFCIAGGAICVGASAIFVFEMLLDSRRGGVLVVPVVSSELDAPIIIIALFVVRGAIGRSIRSAFTRIGGAASRTARDLAQRRSEAPILFLRSFSDDEQSVRTNDAIIWHAVGAAQSKVRLEEIVAQIMFARGPLVALANPNLRTAPIGAARDVLPLDGWQGAVLHYLQASQIVVCFFGRTQSFLWEAMEIVAARKLNRMILVMPPGYPGDRLLTRDAPELARHLGINDEASEIELLSHARVIVFDPVANCFRAYASRRGDAFDYEQALLAAAASVVQTIELERAA